VANESSQRPAASGTPSIISGDLKVTGNLHSNGDLQIDGVIDGDIQSRSLTIGETARIKGAVP
jgi:cytoskeletal protein CcmA (bactofilin family)